MSTEVEKIFEDAGSIMHGHFVLTSGRHSAVYWEKFRVIEQPIATVKLCGMMAEHYRNLGIDVVAGPTTGGVILA
ncbi:MAG: orotate phosphoribosyltransferase, partial [Dehalococcoidia bacterium]|nr:orotate phosphoribosyltransferase [Dehalococcoidia bacterium]